MWKNGYVYHIRAILTPLGSWVLPCRLTRPFLEKNVEGSPLWVGTWGRFLYIFSLKEHIMMATNCSQWICDVANVVITCVTVTSLECILRKTHYFFSTECHYWNLHWFASTDAKNKCISHFGPLEFGSSSPLNTTALSLSTIRKPALPKSPHLGWNWGVKYDGMFSLVTSPPFSLSYPPFSHSPSSYLACYCSQFPALFLPLFTSPPLGMKSAVLWEWQWEILFSVIGNAQKCVQKFSCYLVIL